MWLSCVFLWSFMCVFMLVFVVFVASDFWGPWSPKPSSPETSHCPGNQTLLSFWPCIIVLSHFLQSPRCSFLFSFPYVRYFLSFISEHNQSSPSAASCSPETVMGSRRGFHNAPLQRHSLANPHPHTCLHLHMLDPSPAPHQPPSPLCCDMNALWCLISGSVPFDMSSLCLPCSASN